MAQTGERPPGDPVALVLDDGTKEENWEALLIEQYLLNRFSPAEFPILLEELAVFIPESPFPFVVQLAIFSDPDGNPFNGADLLRTLTVTTTTFEQFTVIPLDPPLFLEGPGDVLIGLDSGGAPFVGVDTDNPQGRSILCFWEVPWQMPCLGFVIEGGNNLMIRGFGTVEVPVELQSFSVE
jgi:hypothetical protein